MPNKKRKLSLRLKFLRMLPSYFGYIFVHLTQKGSLRPELSPKFLSTLGPNPIRKARPDLQLCINVSIKTARIFNTKHKAKITGNIS